MNRFDDTQTHHFNILEELTKTNMLKIQKKKATLLNSTVLKKATLLNSTVLNCFIQHLFIFIRNNKLYQTVSQN